MITTVTTTVITILSTATNASLVIIPIVALVAFLIQKEVASGLTDPRAKRFSQALNIALLPLFIVFAIAVLLKIVQMFH